jgi:hypothetical protein
MPKYTCPHCHKPVLVPDPPLAQVAKPPARVRNKIAVAVIVFVALNIAVWSLVLWNWRLALRPTGTPGAAAFSRSDLFDREKIESKLAGLRMADVRRLLGDPDEVPQSTAVGLNVMPSDPNEDLWVYHKRTYDPKTDKVDAYLFVWFRFGRVVHVSNN